MLIRTKKHKRIIARIILPMLLVAGVGVLSPTVSEASFLGGILGGIFENGSDSSNGKIKKQLNKPLSEADKLLFYALRNNDWELANRALQEGADVNAYNEDVGLPIDQVLSSTGNYEMIEWLIQNGADPEGWIDFTNGNKGTTHYYIFRSRAADIPFWIDHGIDPNIKNSAGITPINAVLNIAETSGTFQEQLQAIKYLVEHGADINHKTPNGFFNIHTGTWSNETPLMWAADKGWVELTQYLLDAGADPNIRGMDNNKQTALDVAMSRDRQSIVKILIQHTKRTPTKE